MSATRTRIRAAAECAGLTSFATCFSLTVWCPCRAEQVCTTLAVRHTVPKSGLTLKAMCCRVHRSSHAGHD